MASELLVNIGSSTGFLPDGTGHYLNQNWFTINEVRWYLIQHIFDHVIRFHVFENKTPVSAACNVHIGSAILIHQKQWQIHECLQKDGEQNEHMWPFKTSPWNDLWNESIQSHGGPSEAGDCSHPPPKMATAENPLSMKAIFDNVIGRGSLRFLVCE